MRKIIKVILRIILLICIVLLLIMFFFNIQRILREKNTDLMNIAPQSGTFFTASDGVRVFYQTYGKETDPLIFLIHGTGTWGEIWKDTSVALSKENFQVIALDLPPFGYSDKPKASEEYSRTKQAQRILDLISSFEEEKVIVVGHSVGARPVTEAVLMNPEKFSKMVLVDPALGFPKTEISNPTFVRNSDAFLMATFFNLEPLRNMVISSYGTNPLFIERLMKSFVSVKESITPERVEIVQRPLNAPNTTQGYGAWLAYLTVGEDYSLGTDFNNLKQISIPTLLIWGETDTVTPLWQGKELHTLIKNSELEVFEGLGHIPYIEDSEKFNTALLQFLKK